MKFQYFRRAAYHSMIEQNIRISTDTGLFRSLASSIHQILLVIDPDTYCIEYCNRFRANHTPETIYGADIFQFISPEYLDEYREKLERVKQDRKPENIVLVGQSSMHAGGKAWYRTDIIPHFSDTGEISKILIISEDITSLKMKEFEVVDSGERLKAIVNNTPDVICSINSGYQLLEFNSVFANLVEKGYRKIPQSGDPVLRYIDPRRHEKLKAIYQRVLTGESITDVEVFGDDPLTEMHFETRYHPICLHDGSIGGIAVFSKNITCQIRQKEALKEALREKEILLAEIHHRIKNNLSLVSGMLELQLIKSTDPLLIEALNNSRYRIRTTALVHELLYSNETYNQLSLHLYLERLFSLLSVNRQRQIIISGEDPVLEFETAMPLGLMLNELMLNSIKHASGSESAKTFVSIDRTEGELQIMYADSSGTFPDDIDFETSDSTGLTLIRTFAEQMGGGVQLRQLSPPKFLIRIPFTS